MCWRARKCVQSMSALIAVLFFIISLHSLRSCWISDPLLIALVASSVAWQDWIWTSLWECPFIFSSAFFQFVKGIVIHAPPLQSTFNLHWPPPYSDVLLLCPPLEKFLYETLNILRYTELHTWSLHGYTEIYGAECMILVWNILRYTELYVWYLWNILTCTKISCNVYNILFLT